RKGRGGVGLPLGLGIFFSFLYILFMQFAEMFSIKGGFPPLIASWIPNIVFGVLSIYLLIKTPK
ncbi:MAG TPA: YjgP/YjgQ family permease, partial [Sphingobacteriaceae bacterium]|nr:YjgP/YjgQ family permease [Sphingobacteriaceae bacterium]